MRQDASLRSILTASLVRQVYYRLISPPYQLFPNTATNYKTFDKILTKARETEGGGLEEDRGQGEEHTRRREERCSILQNDTSNGSLASLTSDITTSRTGSASSNHVEVWVEKDALSTLFERAVKQYRIVVFPSRGYSSYTKVMEALERFPQREERHHPSLRRP